MTSAPLRIIADDPNLLASIRDLYARRPETLDLEAWELQSLLWSLGYTDCLAPEADIEAAMEVAALCLQHKGPPLPSEPGRVQGRQRAARRGPGLLQGEIHRSAQGRYAPGGGGAVGDQDRRTQGAGRV